MWDEDPRTGRPSWRATPQGKTQGTRQSLQMTPGDIATLAALARRQEALAARLDRAGQLLAVQAISTAPFTTGLGNAHPLENGFAFLNPYGLPYLAGSGVKGVLRRAAEELAAGAWGAPRGWDKAAVEALFGFSDVRGEQHRRGALSCWDVLPRLKGDRLQVDVMTAHQSHYHQQRTDARNGDSVSPHDSGQPNPIQFLAVPPGSIFRFHLLCDLDHLRRHAPRLADDGNWQSLMQAALELAFDWLGFGAKTAVGYGAMREDPAERQRREAARAEAERQAAARAEAERLASMSPEDQAWESARPAIEAFRAEFERARQAPFNPGGPFTPKRQEFVKLASGWTEARSRSAAGELLAATATKDWGRPSNKDRWTELQAVIASLRGDKR